MYYQSTRSKIKASDVEAVLKGIADDGGLFVMSEESCRGFDWKGCLKLSSLGMAERILSALLPGFENMEELVNDAYSGKFETDDLTPLVPVGDKYVLELFRGPTSAFKDVALSMLPQLITAAHRQTGSPDETVILTATSGDTGKAALEGFHDVDGTRILVFYPENGVSPIQKAQMVTQSGSNVCVCAINGNFDDCQRGIKEAFAAINSGKLLKGRGMCLSSANSINIGRLAPQVVYYFIAYAKLVDSGRIKVGDIVDYTVPTGNFGDILAGYYAKLLGLPVGKLVCASNANRVLTDFINTGIYDRRREFMRTSSPSMDILVSSNLERMLYLSSDGSTDLVSDCMEKLSRDGVYTVDAKTLARIRSVFYAASADEEDTSWTIGKVWHDFGYLCDPHTAVAFCAAEQYERECGSASPMVILSTASPYKFPTPVLQAVGGNTDGDEFRQIESLNRLSGVPIPKNLSALENRAPLHTDVIERDNILQYILKQLGIREA